MEGKSVEENDAQPTERTAALWGLSSKIDSRIWVNFTRNGLRLGSRHQEPPTHRRVEEFGYSCHQTRLTWAKEKKNWTVTQWYKVLFQMRTGFGISFENQVLESGGRVEKLIAQVAWSPVLRFHSLWWFGGAMSSTGVDPLCFLKTNVTAPHLPRNFGALHDSFWWPAF